MGSAHHHPPIPSKPPGKVNLPSNYVPATIAAAVIGLVVFVAGLFIDPLRAWKSYLIGLTFFTMLAVSGPFLLAVTYLTRAGWGVSLRRIPEAFTWGLPVAGLLSMVMLGGVHTVYEWTDPVIAADPIVSKKLPYLNFTFMAGRTVFAYAAMSVLALWMVKNSYAQDRDGDPKHTHLSGKLSSIFLVIMSLGLTFISVDFIMSLQPHWFSTMWTVNYWSSMFQAGMALMTIYALWLLQRGDLKGFVNGNHIHDYGKLTFAATPFWGYIAFCQFLLIWYANLPEEALFFNQRTSHGWTAWTAALPLLKFILPFFYMLPRDVKRGKGLMPVCYWILGATFLELYWWVAPAPAPGVHHPAPSLPWMEVLVTVGFLGLFAFVVGKMLTRENIVPIKDPRLHEVFHHHQ